MNASPPVLQGEGVTFAYPGGEAVLRGLDFCAEAGRLLCVLGPNGSGKTTLLRCLLGQWRPQQGTIALEGKALHSYSRRRLARLMAYVPQIPVAAFAFSVRELVLMGRFAHTGVLGLTTQQDRSVARQAMIMTQTLQFAGRTLGELSGGEAQRVMIARALSQQPSVLLLDEPTSHLDVRNQLLIYRMMMRLAHEWGMAVVCVSHDLNLAGRFSDRMLLMRDGQVLADGPPGEVVRRDVLSAAYDVEIDLIEIPDATVPMVRVR